MAEQIPYDIPENTPKSRCRGCHSIIYWVKTPARKNMPVDPDGGPHWATCPKAKDFKRNINPKVHKRGEQT